MIPGKSKFNMAQSNKINRSNGSGSEKKNTISGLAMQIVKPS